MSTMVHSAGAKQRSATTKKQRTLNAILRAGAEVFADKGYPSATVRDVVDVPELSEATFFNHFKYKRSLAHLMIERLLDNDSDSLQVVTNRLVLSNFLYPQILHSLMESRLQGESYSDAIPLTHATMVGLVTVGQQNKEYSNQFSPQEYSDFILDSISTVSGETPDVIRNRSALALGTLATHFNS